MAIRSGEKNESRFGEVQLSIIGQFEVNLAGLQEVHMPSGLASVKGRNPAKSTTVKGASVNSKMSKQR